ncbi:MAG TPA: hypothetical protein VFC00_33115 [Micromonosporaceae bacterium]|nr:hypothetical protein [Micromonosporaceae bacterium]
MSIGAETLGNGAAQAGYRGRRDGGVVAVDPLTDAALSPPALNGVWLDSPTGQLADHPLLRGLLMELPAKGSQPPQEWLDRWFEAARSILELLYVHQAARR